MLEINIIYKTESTEPEPFTQIIPYSMNLNGILTALSGQKNIIEKTKYTLPSRKNAKELLLRLIFNLKFITEKTISDLTAKFKEALAKRKLQKELRTSTRET